MAILKSSPISTGTYHISVGGTGGGGFGSLSDGSATSITSVSTEPIQGKMITVDIVYSCDDLERLGLTSVPNYFEDSIKKELILKLSHAIARENYVEFTKQDNYAEHSITYRARIYATPDDKVRLIRKQGIE
jgi:hypothetical protein